MIPVMRTLFPALLLVLAAAAAPAQSASGWKLVWSDEFNGPAGSAPDPKNWNYDLGGGGWGNAEAETYTNSTDNSFQDGKGNLVIRALRDGGGRYTSARLQTGSPGASTHTADGNWQYGRIEARLKLPYGKGVWPAFWMLGANFSSAGWPACGEIDIMENFGTFQNNISINNGTAHGPGYSGNTALGGHVTLPFGRKVNDDYHVYAIEWAQDSIRWLVDNVEYFKLTPASLPSGRQWVFNNPFFILLNVAIGTSNTGATGGGPDPNAPFPPQDMLVDYVRVYQTAPVADATPVITPGEVRNAASFLGDVAPGSLATVYGASLADAEHPVAPDPNFPTSVAGVTVSVAGVNAALTYVSPTQINFQVPWETAPGTSVEVKVTRNGTESNIEPITIAATSAPGMFLSEFTNGVAWVTGQGCATSVCTVQPGGVYQLWANGFGPKNGAQQNGVPAPYTGSLTPLEVPGGPAACQLTIAGQPATVTYCGAAPFEIIDQLNFVYPPGVPAGQPYVDATLTINGVTGGFRVPSPLTADQRAGLMLSRMSQDEKLRLVQGAAGPVTNIIPLPRGAGGWIPGNSRLAIPDLYFVDGSLGLADSQAPATALPSSIASAAAWDLDLAYAFGKVIGAETAAYGLNVNLGGNVNLIGREPRDGRTFETKGEDPILAGKITAAHIRGVQDQHVIGGTKHFALNDQETGRTQENVIIDERAARETDLLAFEIAIKDSNALSVMCSYNLVNGAWACENSHLLNEVLKRDWGFQGFVMSDWWATHSGATAALAGLDQEQPNNQYFGGLDRAVQSGELPQSRLDDMARRVLRSMYAAGLFDHPNTIAALDTAAGQVIAQQVEEQGAVLLKNAGRQLPLDASALRSIAVIGSHADIGVLSGGGSAQVYPTGGPALMEGYPNPPGWAPVIWHPSSPLKAIQAKAPNATVKFDAGTSTTTAASLAAASDVAIVFVSQWASEGMDLPALTFTDVIHSPRINQDALVNAVSAANPRTIVVMENGGPQYLPWLSNVSAVLEAWYPGQRGGEAIANILFGAVNPSGKLPVTFPASQSDLPRPSIAAPPNSTAIFNVNYFEGLQTGYKWFDARNITPQFPFGFGLSYTTFSISNPAVSGRDVSFDVANTGPVPGAEVAQVYLGLPPSTGEPPKRLVAWTKVFLQPGAQQHVTLPIDETDSSHPMSYWDVDANAWRTAPGDYTVYVGNSSAKEALTVAGTIRVES
jgi:beta-glucosidase